MDATATNVQRAAPRPSTKNADLLAGRSRVMLAASFWGALGFAGSSVLTVTGTRLLGRGAVQWWFSPNLFSSHLTTKLVFYAGVAALVAGWLGLGRELARSPALRVRGLLVVGALWCLPLALGAPLFSRDVYSYIAQGTLFHLGRNPYHVPPLALAHLGQAQTLAAVSHLWQRTTAPYGPLFLAVVGLFVGATGSNLVVCAILVRLLEILGIVLLGVALPRLARLVGGDPRRAVWLMLLSPLVLLQLVSPAHNDALMVGMMAVGVAVALERRPLLGIAICALAATVKVPAAAAAVFIAVAWARETPGARDRIRVIAQSAVVFAVVIAAVSVATGVGLSWVSSGLFSTPGKVHLAITPATSLGYTVAGLLRDLGVGIGGHTLAAIFSRVVFGFTGVFAVWVLYRVRFMTLVWYLGIVLVVAAVGGPAAWPWYLSWGLVLLAASPKGPLWGAMPLVLVVGALVVTPAGILVLPIQAAPYVLVLYLVIALIAVWYVRMRKRLGPPNGPPPVSSASVLAQR